MSFRTIIAVVAAGAVSAFNKIEGVIKTVEGSNTATQVASILQDTNVGTKLANSMMKAETAALPAIDAAKVLFAEVKDDVAKIVGEAKNVEHLTLAAVSTFIADFKAVV